MMSLVRPPAHADFAAESAEHLDELRVIAEAGTAIGSNHFKNRTLWSKPKHKKALVGEAGEVLNATDAGLPIGLAKCAWCEQHFEWKRQLDVEHYRPKAEVTRWEGSPPLVSNKPPEQIWVSDGYWWLAFDWTNYSLACGPCNQGWKRSLFPVREPREAHAEGMEAREHVLLLDPMSPFRTSEHFSWTHLGFMNPESDRGEATIITCGLNRSPLVALRAKAARNARQALQSFERVVETPSLAKPHLRTLRELCDPTSEFAGMSRWWVEYTLGWTWEQLVEAAS